MVASIHTPAPIPALITERAQDTPGQQARVAEHELISGERSATYAPGMLRDTLSISGEARAAAAGMVEKDLEERPRVRPIEESGSPQRPRSAASGEEHSSGTFPPRAAAQRVDLLA